MPGKYRIQFTRLDNHISGWEWWLTLTRKLEAVLVTVASAVEEQNWSDFVKSVHIIPLQIKIMAKNITLNKRPNWKEK